MIDVKDVEYDLVVYSPAGQRLSLNDALKSLEWEEQPEELAVRLTAELHNAPYGSGHLHQLLPLGGKVFLFSDWGEGWQEIFRGTIFRPENLEDPLRNVTITAYDSLIYLAKSQDDRLYASGTKGKTIIEDIAKAWKIPIGTIEGPNVGLSKQVYRSQRLSQMYDTVIKESKKRGDGKYIVRSKQDKIDVIRPGKNTPVYSFVEGVSNPREIQSIENLITRVKVVGAASDGERRPIIATMDGRTEFGILQELVYEDQYDTPAAAKTGAKELLDERGKPEKQQAFEHPDLPFLRRGDKIYVRRGTLNGYYIVSGISHNATKRTMRVEVEDE
ncbi:XkdQ/YqbQ family protein [Paenibacillus alkalitolerans]|uniref:XkdQ/YqbQ family protein n=1 Tax=Paenibacillus alkalitolerans TaxID=2799335 RepID=UPI0018F507ED|nr:hypothetical protein [Paenibacillus alkalitolerans]